MMQRNWELLFPKTTLCIIYSDAVSVLFFSSQWDFIDVCVNPYSQRKRKNNWTFFVLIIVTLHLFVLQKLTLLQCWPQPNFWVIKIEAECKNDYHKLVCWTIRFSFQSKSRQKWVSMVGNYKKSTFKIPKK